MFPGVREVEDWMSRASGVGLEELRPHLFLLRDRDATGHLLRVAGAPGWWLGRWPSVLLAALLLAACRLLLERGISGQASHQPLRWAGPLTPPRILHSPPLPSPFLFRRPGLAGDG